MKVLFYHWWNELDILHSCTITGKQERHKLWQLCSLSFQTLLSRRLGKNILLLSILGILGIDKQPQEPRLNTMASGDVCPLREQLVLSEKWNKTLSILILHITSIPGCHFWPLDLQVNSHVYRYWCVAWMKSKTKNQ